MSSEPARRNRNTKNVSVALFTPKIDSFKGSLPGAAGGKFGRPKSTVTLKFPVRKKFEVMLPETKPLGVKLPSSAGLVTRKSGPVRPSVKRFPALPGQNARPIPLVKSNVMVVVPARIGPWAASRNAKPMAKAAQALRGDRFRCVILKIWKREAEEPTGKVVISHGGKALNRRQDNTGGVKIQNLAT